MTVVLVDPRRPSLVPVDAVALLTGEVAYTEELPVVVPWSLPAARPVHAGGDAPVLLSSDPQHPAVTARLAAGEALIAAPEPPTGERLVDAVALMDRLRSTGPWEQEQSHASLRRFLLEETYELFDAVERGDYEELRAELGDVLLQVLFHARIAQEVTPGGFTIDDVADALVRKLTGRAANVLAGESVSRDDQLTQWERTKAREKTRLSVVDDIPTAQPALALAQKVIRRVTRAGFPPDLIPEAITRITVTADADDVEITLRAAVVEFIEAIRRAERVAAQPDDADTEAAPLETTAPGPISEERWRTAWAALQP
ncbi:nucleoside triphosphate pyrophosphohydrolase [Mycobacterium sp. 1274756.6]|uniref:nucleoside triphosphate pyrophosphohydrolase n=1 Tax=Mycobacterium sp. 1274756.6 TaxID=1834076 RepID=UPI0007FBB072|nr:nucleoside triphosphate pyrophosphohydrolase [Mycobacterium sp. 1274756.6]OBJ67932.1 nucleoside triphosphate hydrolase [Mycobacterium sp. 1274756.6]